jgi:hypothetical protein
MAIKAKIYGHQKLYKAVKFSKKVANLWLFTYFRIQLYNHKSIKTCTCNSFLWHDSKNINHFYELSVKHRTIPIL